MYAYYIYNFSTYIKIHPYVIVKYLQDATNLVTIAYNATKLRITGFWVIDLKCEEKIGFKFKKLKKTMTCFTWQIYGITSIRQKKKSLKLTTRQLNNTFMWLLLQHVFFKSIKICQVQLHVLTTKQYFPSFCTCQFFPKLV